MLILPPQKKALLVTTFFTISGILAAYYQVKNWQLALPLVIFYIILLINTYFSIKLFSQIISPQDKVQICVDLILVGLYTAVAVNINSPLYFVFFLLLMFIIASAKYTFLLELTSYNLLLKKKILVDLLGVLACALTLGGIIIGYEFYSIWFLTIGFLIANILLFFVWPLYVLN